MRRAGPWIVKGLMAERLGRLETAIDSYRKASELEPRLERPWRDLARIYLSRGLVAFAEEAELRAEEARAKTGKGREGRAGQSNPPRTKKTMDGIPRPRKPR
jgi:Flp pilus assembly protein TadD